MTGILQVDFEIDVQPGYSPKNVALTAAQNRKATWIVLDRLVYHLAFKQILCISEEIVKPFEINSHVNYGNGFLHLPKKKGTASRNFKSIHDFGFAE